MTIDPGDAELAASWCAQLEDLARFADEDGWRSDLNAAIDAVRSGQSVHAALFHYQIPMATADDTERGMFDIGDLRIDPVPVGGVYRCGWNRDCDRRARRDDVTGAEPKCPIRGHIMEFLPE